MANKEHVERLLAGVEGWNQWRRENPEVRPDLWGADLEGADLIGADLQGANLQGADLSRANIQDANLFRANLFRADLQGADLQDANLFRADLRGADLQGADLVGADLRGADLVGADLRGADLRGVNLQGANLQGADLSRAIFASTTVTAVDLREVHGLESVDHRAPSSIGLDTIEVSQGRIPESFLRGCGVSDRLIEYIPSLTMQPIQYYSCFISYADEDRALAERIHADLQAKGVRCWYAPHDLEIGEPILSGIDRGIRLHDKLLLILSAASVESAWIEQEVYMALARERNERRHVLFPIRIDDTVSAQTAGWPALVWSQRHVGDFCQWKDHDAYQEAFKRVLRDLTTKTDPPPAT